MWQTYNIINAEYPASLQIIMLVFLAALLFIVGTACFEIFEAHKRERANQLSSFLLWKIMGGPFLIDPAFWAKLLIATYLAHTTTQRSLFGSDVGATDDSFILRPESVLLCIFVLITYAAMRRVYGVIENCKKLRQGVLHSLLSAIFSRVIAGSALIAVMHFVPNIEEGLQVFL